MEEFKEKWDNMDLCEQQEFLNYHNEEGERLYNIGHYKESLCHVKYLYMAFKCIFMDTVFGGMPYNKEVLSDVSTVMCYYRALKMKIWFKSLLSKN